MTNKIEAPTATEILDALRMRGASDHIQVEEFAFTGGNRRIDFWDLHVHPSKGHEATAYEIKVSRSDFKRDTAVKQREARLWSDRFYYVCPKGMVRLDEIPDWAGLMEWDGNRLSVVLPAPKRDKDAPSWDLIVSLIRNSTAIRRDADPRLKFFSYYETRNKELEAENQSLRGEGIHRRVFECRIRPDLVVKVEREVPYRHFANVLEQEFWREHGDNEKIARWLAPCDLLSPDGRILLQRRAEPIGASFALPEKLPAFLADIKRSNFGILDGNLVCVDYGVVNQKPSIRESKVIWTD